MERQSHTLGPKDKKDFEKFLKFLALKAVQVIVQSRNGERIHTASKPPAVGQHWFNLAIEDVPEITNETKKIMEGRLPCQEQPMCIEISLKTNEGEAMVLETWCLGMNNRKDSHAKITFTVYNRMGMLLKSLVSVTRVTPAYRLARKQGIDYEICYRVYFGDVRITELGEGFQTMHVGSVGTPVGSVTLSAAYRTNLSLAHRQPDMPVKSDHYSSQEQNKYHGHEASWDIPIPCAPGTQAQLHVGEGVRHVAEEIANASETEVTSCGRTQPTTYRNRRSPTQLKQSSNQGTVTKPFSITSGHQTKGAFAGSPISADIPSLPALSSTPPFASLLSTRNSLGSRPETPEDLVKGSNKNSLGSSSRKDSSSESMDSKHPPDTVAPSLWGGEDGFVLVELRPAFASPSSGDGDLGCFYRQCQKPLPLNMFDDRKTQTFDSVMDELDEQLSTFSECLPIFDELVANLQTSQSG